MSIRIRGLDYRRGQFTLRVPDLDISPGKITGVIGKNGSGKSTLLKLLEGFLEPTFGSISIFGREVSDYDAIDLARKVSFVQQEISDPLGFSVREVLSVSGYSRDHSYPDMENAMRMLGVESLMDRKFSELSGGERRLITIAASIYQGSDIMLLDEPTTFLDVDKQMIVHSVLDRIRDDGKTVVVVLHDLNAIYKLCDDTVILRNGELVAHGNTRDVMVSGLLREAFDVDFTIYDTPEGKGFLPTRQLVFP